MQWTGPAALVLAAAHIGAAAAEPAPLSAQGRAIRDFALFAHRKIADEAIQGQGVHLDTLRAAFGRCTLSGDWLRQLALHEVETDAFAARLTNAYETRSGCESAHASAAPPSQSATAADPASDPAWLALLHYRARPGGGWESQADHPAFFLSPDGKHAPAAELRANLAALARPDYACRFPARHAWLRALQGAAAAPDCAPLQAWLANFPGRRISISFAASYLESPSSMFGHTFLKVYRESPRELLSPTINYAARTEANVGDLDFVRRGLLGGFPGVADELPFYRRLRTYTENEGRDIWEYELKLAPAEIHTLLLHLWEVRDGIFDYYFLDENCAYRTLALIDVLRPGLGLLRGHGLTVPVATLRTLQAHGLVGEPTVWPAFARLVREHEASLDAAQVAQARALAAGAAPAGAAAGVLQLAYEYLSVQINRDQARRGSGKSVMNAILRTRAAQAQPAPLAQALPKAPPDGGHEGSPWSLGQYRAGGRRAATLAWALFEHRLTDRLAGYEPHAEITVLRPELRSAGGKLRLGRMDWLAVQSSVPATPLFSRTAWRAQLATAPQAYRARDHLVTSLSLHAGRAWTVGRASLAVMPGAALEAGRALGAAAGTLLVQASRQGADWSLQAEWQADQLLLGQHGLRSAARLRSTLVLSRNAALELQLGRSLQPRPLHQASLALKLFFPP